MVCHVTFMDGDLFTEHLPSCGMLDTTRNSGTARHPSNARTPLRLVNNKTQEV